VIDQCSFLNIFTFQILGQDFVLGGRAVTPHVSNLHEEVDHTFKRHQELLEFKTGI
jgi:hypothetical protein